MINHHKCYTSIVPRFMLPPSFPGLQADRQFNNADSFAAAFDATWRQYASKEDTELLTQQERLDSVLRQLADHPFAVENASRAREVGEFRLRLHGL
jgi:hypothetical protein